MATAPAHYGSVAAEIAVCTKTAGLVERSRLRQLALSGPEPLLDHVLGAAVSQGAPGPGRAVCMASTWCCRTTACRAIVAAAGLPGELRIPEVADVTLAGAPLTVVREDGDSYLLLFERGYPPEASQALWSAGREHGLAPVGTKALELLHAAHRSFG